MGCAFAERAMADRCRPGGQGEHCMRRLILTAMAFVVVALGGDDRSIGVSPASARQYGLMARRPVVFAHSYRVLARPAFVARQSKVSFAGRPVRYVHSRRAQKRLPDDARLGAYQIQNGL